MIASINGRPKRAARMTELGLPPTPTQVGMCLSLLSRTPPPSREARLLRRLPQAGRPLLRGRLHIG
jgi:hypothetical protein